MLADICSLVLGNKLVLFSDFVLTALLAYPVGVFVWRGWHQTAEEVCWALNAKAKKRYFANFLKKKVPVERADQAFKDFYYDTFGLKHYIAPILFLAVVALFENFFLARALIDLIQAPKTGEFSLAAAAIAGAYMTVGWNLIGHMQRRTLSRADILRSALRLVVAVPVGLSFGLLLNASLAGFAAFAMGAFPLQTIIVISQRLMKKRLDLATTDPQAARDQLVFLTGIDTLVAERIEDADITTITQLAWADPVELTMRTNLQFAFTLDLVSQALAWVYLEDKLKSLGVVGLRGAVEIRSALKVLGEVHSDEDEEEHEDRVVMDKHETTVGPYGIRKTDLHVEVNPESDPQTSSPKSTEATAAKKAIEEAAKIAQVDPVALRYALIQIGDDPIAKFLSISWSSLTSGR